MGGQHHPKTIIVVIVVRVVVVAIRGGSVVLIVVEGAAPQHLPGSLADKIRTSSIPEKPLSRRSVQELRADTALRG